MKITTLKAGLTGSAVATGCTLIAALLALIDGQLELPVVLHSILEIITRPFLFFGSLITYFCIVGDDWIPSRDFLKYVLPISIVVNAFFGFLCGWAFHRFRTGSKGERDRMGSGKAPG